MEQELAEDSLEDRVEALEELVFALVHHVNVESPLTAKPVALRLKLHSVSPHLTPASRRLFGRVARLMGGGGRYE